MGYPGQFRVLREEAILGYCTVLQYPEAGSKVRPHFQADESGEAKRLVHRSTGEQKHQNYHLHRTFEGKPLRGRIGGRLSETAIDRARGFVWHAYLLSFFII